MIHTHSINSYTECQITKGENLSSIRKFRLCEIRSCGRAIAADDVSDAIIISSRPRLSASFRPAFGLNAIANEHGRMAGWDLDCTLNFFRYSNGVPDVF